MQVWWKPCITSFSLNESQIFLHTACQEKQFHCEFLCCDELVRNDFLPVKTLKWNLSDVQIGKTDFHGHNDHIMIPMTLLSGMRQKKSSQPNIYPRFVQKYLLKSKKVRGLRILSWPIKWRSSRQCFLQYQHCAAARSCQEHAHCTFDFSTSDSDFVPHHSKCSHIRMGLRMSQCQILVSWLLLEEISRFYNFHNYQHYFIYYKYTHIHKLLYYK